MTSTAVGAVAGGSTTVWGMLAGVRKGMGLLGSLVSLESLIAGSDGARRPAIIPADHPSIVATSVLGEGVSATVCCLASCAAGLPLPERHT